MLNSWNSRRFQVRHDSFLDYHFCSSKSVAYLFQSIDGLGVDDALLDVPISDTMDSSSACILKFLYIVRSPIRTFPCISEGIGSQKKYCHALMVK